MQAIDIEWSQTEQKVAKEAFDKAYEREIKSLMALVQQVRSHSLMICGVCTIF
jgi:hypothetical protein